MILPTTMAKSTRSFFCRTLLLLAIAATALALESETEPKDLFAVLDRTGGGPVSFAPQSQPLTLLTPEPDENEIEKEETTPTLLRGGSNININRHGNALESQSQSDPQLQLQLPPIPPIHPRHTGSVHYSSIMNSDGTTTYRRDINAPCDYGMLVFNVGPAEDDMPYEYEIYGDAYLWSDNAGLCVLYPSYTGYQLSTTGPFWRLGYDPMVVNFKDLGAEFRHMHRISSRILAPADGSAQKNSNKINKHTAGDYVIMGHHDFYSIEYYKQLKQFINSWGSESEAEAGTASEPEPEPEPATESLSTTTA